VGVSERVGFIGLGTMGGPMATNLATAGVLLAVHDTSAAASAALATLRGVVVGPSPAEVAAQTTTLFTCLPNDDIVRAVYLGPNGIATGAREGLVTCDCSTVSPETSVELNRALASKGVTHLDTPMLGSQPQAVSGEIFFIVGGDAAKVPTIAPYLEIMGKLHTHVGGPGMGNRVKLLHNGLAAVTAVAVAEALAVCVQSGVDPYVFYEVVLNGGGMAYGRYFERRAKRILDGDFSPTFAVELMRKDAGLALDLARSAKVPTPMLEETKRTYDEAVQGGWGHEDFSAVTHVIEQRIGRRLSER
jgi:3-hydroxyisobutyrate dehydrogenase-like beta-hydroxyacid dehydrogenase